jgi:hypothetical protein
MNANGEGGGNTRGWPIREGDVLPPHTIAGGFWVENTTVFPCNSRLCRGPLAPLLYRLYDLLPEGWRPSVHPETLAAARKRSAKLVTQLRRDQFYHRRRSARAALSGIVPVAVARGATGTWNMSCVVCGRTYSARFGHPPTTAEGRRVLPACFIPSNQVRCPPSTR